MVLILTPQVVQWCVNTKFSVLTIAVYSSSEEALLLSSFISRRHPLPDFVRFMYRLILPRMADPVRSARLLRHLRYPIFPPAVLGFAHWDFGGAVFIFPDHYVYHTSQRWNSTIECNTTWIRLPLEAVTLPSVWVFQAVALPASPPINSFNMMRMSTDKQLAF